MRICTRKNESVFLEKQKMAYGKQSRSIRRPQAGRCQVGERRNEASRYEILVRGEGKHLKKCWCVSQIGLLYQRDKARKVVFFVGSFSKPGPWQTPAYRWAVCSWTSLMCGQGKDGGMKPSPEKSREQAGCSKALS